MSQEMKSRGGGAPLRRSESYGLHECVVELWYLATGEPEGFEIRVHDSRKVYLAAKNAAALSQILGEFAEELGDGSE